MHDVDSPRQPTRRSPPLDALARVAALLLLVACSDLGRGRPTPTEPTAPTATQSPPNVDCPDSIHFDDASITVAPGQTVTLNVTVEPAASNVPVRLALFADTPIAFLNASELLTSELGKASFSLTVTSTSQPLRVQASCGNDVITELEVEVSGAVLANVQVNPSYAGKRPIDAWRVRFEEGADCSDYGAFKGPDAILVDFGKPIDLSNVPAQRPMTILVSSHEYAYGCAVRSLEPGKENAVSVIVTDRPLQISSLEFPFSLDLNRTPELTAHLASAVDLMVAGFRRNGATDVVTLLQQMADLAPSQEDFRAEMIRSNWEERLTAALTPEGAESGLSSRVALWLRTGAARLTEEPLLRGLMMPSDSPNRAFFDLDTIAGIDPASVQMPVQYGVSVKAEGEDAVRAAFKVYLLPSLLLSVLADLAAQADGAESVVDALEHSLDASQGPFCARVAAVLAPLGNASVDAGGLPELEPLCHQALIARWDAVGTSVTRPAVIDVTALGPTTINDQAQVTGFAGSWVGTTDLLGTGPVALAGSFSSEEAQGAGEN
jgi:hypothetical protein